jgi:hypothetical protein
MLLLSDMQVDVVEGYTSLHDTDGSLRLFRRKLLETDELDEVCRRCDTLSSQQHIDTCCGCSG